MHLCPPPSLSRRQLLARAAAALLVPAVASCSAPLAPMRVGCIVFPGYETMFLARELGLLDPQQVRLVELLANTDTLRALAAGQLEAAALTLDELMTARADGVDLRAVLVFDVSEGADVVLATPHTTLQNLAGKRIGAEEGAMGALMLSALLNAAGLQPAQIRKVTMTLDRSEEMFDSGGLDAVVTAEPWATRMEKKGAQRIFDSRSMPGRVVDVLAVRADALPTYAASLRHVLDCHFTALQQMQEFASRSAELLVRRLQTPAGEVMGLYRGLRQPDRAQNRSMLAPGGMVDLTAQKLQTVMVEAGLLQPELVLQALVEPRFLFP